MHDSQNLLVLKKPFGNYGTNCYILKLEKGEVIIDPGMGASSWVLDEVKNPLAIMLTHGHYDHIWDVHILQKELKDTPIYCPLEDEFMLSSDCFSLGLTPCKADFYIEGNKSEYKVEVGGATFSFFHFPGHTPGCSIIKVNNHIFSGDFIFKRNIGRFDFPYSNQDDMIDSLKRFIDYNFNALIHPGHGEDTDALSESANVNTWVKRLKNF